MPTGNLNIGRDSHTGTLLPNGKLLVTGGYNEPAFIIDSAELYDPSTGTWVKTSRMKAHRWYHTATLLPNGKVLVAGGGSDGSPPLIAELYDPSAETWTATGSLRAARPYPTGTLLLTGKVLVAGGSSSTNRAELYEPLPPGYNLLSLQSLGTGDVGLSFVGLVGTNYALERTFTLSPSNWVSLVTNPAGPGGSLIFTNTPDPNTNNFWRIRSVP